jgi:uncharacterized protein (DUF362 family)
LDHIDYHPKKQSLYTRRKFIRVALTGCLAAVGIPLLNSVIRKINLKTETFIVKVKSYETDLSNLILCGLKELNVTKGEINGKRILLKPNLVETLTGAIHINTHPLVLRGAAEAFLSLGARSVIIAEGPGHCRDFLLILEESGLAQILVEDQLRFIDLNFDDVYQSQNIGKATSFDCLTLPQTLKSVDWIVSIAKMKTHHWAGVTLSMKNLFGVMPGSYYGWPKNALHYAGINRSIIDINATVKPHLAIIDGIIGMEGDGPIMGNPVQAGVMVMGRNLPAVDATASRIMGINPLRIPHLKAADGWLGTVRNGSIQQRGETIASVQTNFKLVEDIPAHQNIRL